MKKLLVTENCGIKCPMFPGGQKEVSLEYDCLKCQHFAKKEFMEYLKTIVNDKVEATFCNFSW